MPTLLKDFHKFRTGEKTADSATKVLFAVLNEMFCYDGFRSAWDNAPDSIKEYILESNLEVVKKNLLS